MSLDSTVKALRRLRRITRELVQAEIEDSWKGGGDPDDIPAIEHNLRRARLRWSDAYQNVLFESQQP